MVNTGRTICIIEDVIKELGLDGYICGCGTNIYYHGKEIYHAKLPSELKKGIVNKAVELDIDAVLEGPESIYFPETIKTKTVQEIKERYSDIKVNVPVYHKMMNLILISSLHGIHQKMILKHLRTHLKMI